MADFILRDAKEKFGDEEFFQGVRFELAQLPQIADWEVGREYTLILKVKQTSHNFRDVEGEGQTESATFDILKVGAFQPEEVERMEIVKKKLG